MIFPVIIFVSKREARALKNFKARAFYLSIISKMFENPPIIIVFDHLPHHIVRYTASDMVSYCLVRPMLAGISDDKGAGESWTTD